MSAAKEISLTLKKVDYNAIEFVFEAREACRVNYVRCMTMYTILSFAVEDALTTTTGN